MENEHFDYHYSVDEPYPPARASGPNPIYAAEMLSNMGGCVSEMSAVSLYFYNDLIVQSTYPAIASCFHHISLIEMHHLEIFGKLALALGADPRLWSTRCARKLYWSPAFNRYPREIKSLVRNSIESESAVIAKYSAQADEINDPYIVENLRRIILDEQRHLDIFHNMFAHIRRV